MKLQFGFLCKILIFTGLFLSTPAWALLCREFYPGKTIISVETHHIEAMNRSVEFLKIDGALVTHQLRYPVAKIMNDLGVHEGLLKGKTILTVGEGIGHLLPHLVKYDFQVLGIDPYYFKDYESSHPIAGEIRKFEREFKAHLRRGDATQLPLPNESVDVYLSHAMVNNFTKGQRQQVLKEALRVTEQYGDIYIAGFKRKDREWIEPLLNNSGVSQYHFQKVKGTLNFGNGPFPYSMYRLVIYK